VTPDRRRWTRREALLAAGGTLATRSLCADAAFSPWALAWSPDGKRLACAGGDQLVHVWEIESGKRVGVMKGHDDAVFTLAWSLDAAMIVSGGRGEPTLRLWDARTFQPLRSSTPHPRWVWCARFSPHGKHLATCGGDSVIRVHRAADGAVERELTGHRDTVKRVAWTADSKSLVSGGDDGFVHVWDAASGEELHRLAGHSSWIDALVSGPRSLALTGGGDGTIRLWDVAEGKQLRRFEGRVTDLASAALSPDGETAITGGADGRLRRWNAETGVESGQRSVRATALDLAFSADGKRLASAHREDAVRIWSIPEWALTAVLRP
jgi:WD40 repeat protein